MRLGKLDIQDTLFLVISKSGTTIEIDAKELMTKKYFRKITFEEYRKLLNKIGFGSMKDMKEIGKVWISKFGGLF